MINKVREHHTDKDFGPLFSGEVLRDEGIKKVADNNDKWMTACLRWVENHGLDFGGDFTGEDLRMGLSRCVGCPAHSNAWGALINTLVRRKIIKPTGEYRAMRDDSSHARKTPVYTK